MFGIERRLLITKKTAIYEMDQPHLLTTHLVTYKAEYVSDTTAQ